MHISGMAVEQVSSTVRIVEQSARLRVRSFEHWSVSSNLAAASQLARNQRFVPV